MSSRSKVMFIPFELHKFNTFVCHLPFKKLVDRKNDKVKIKVILETKEENISVTYGSVNFIDSYRFLSSRLD